MISVDLYNMDTEPLWGYASENNVKVKPLAFH